MTEYWQSQARKYCEFCKCWFADNKVSISFHENGKKHKENLKKHISVLGKKSTKEFKQKEKMDNDIKKMEAAAMAAYLKDVQNNADLTSRSINEHLQKTGASSEDIVVEKSLPKSPPVWHEVKSDSGNYFWNTVTNETTWETPEEYLTIAEQEKNKLKKKDVDKAAKILKKEQVQDSVREAKAYQAREQMRKLSVKKEEPVATFSQTGYGPEPRATKPYGTWKTVVTEPVKNIDLQLPKIKKDLPPQPVVVEQDQPEVKLEFKERKVESIFDIDEPIEFKKRKLNVQRKNMRKRLDDD